MHHHRLVVLSCCLLAWTGCAVMKPFEVLSGTREQPETYFGQLIPGIADSSELENEPLAHPFKGTRREAFAEYNSGRHPALAFATYTDGQYCFDYRTLKDVKTEAEAAAARFNSEYSLVIRTHSTLEEIAAAEEWPKVAASHTSKLVDQPHFLLKRPEAQASSPENVLEVCQAGPRLTNDTRFLTVMLVSNLNWRNNTLLVWGFDGKKR